MFHRRNSPSIVSQLSNVVLFVAVSVLLISIPSGVSSSSIARRQDESSAAVVPPLPTAVNPHSPSFWFGQPKSDAEQFLLSDQNDNQVIVPKWFTRSSNDDEDEQDLFVRKRYVTMKKRKHLSKPPMEVMNEIVNSIYLKRWDRNDPLGLLLSRFSSFLTNKHTQTHTYVSFLVVARRQTCADKLVSIHLSISSRLIEWKGNERHLSKPTCDGNETNVRSERKSVWKTSLGTVKRRKMSFADRMFLGSHHSHENGSMEYPENVNSPSSFNTNLHFIVDEKTTLIFFQPSFCRSFSTVRQHHPWVPNSIRPPFTKVRPCCSLGKHR